MSKVRIAIAGLAVIALVGIPAYAGCGSCGAADKAADKAKCSEKCLEGLDLTEDQKAEIDKLVANCTKIGCDKTSAKKMMEGLKSVLSEEQFIAMKAQCTKNDCWGKSKEGDSASLLNVDFQVACGSSCGGGDKKKDDGDSDA